MPASADLDLDIKPSESLDAATRSEIIRNTRHCRVGSILVSESDRVRIWHIAMQPGERLEFHRHVLDYFWTTTVAGRARSRYPDGRVVEADYPFGLDEELSHREGWDVHARPWKISATRS